MYDTESPFFSKKSPILAKKRKEMATKKQGGWDSLSLLAFCIFVSEKSKVNGGWNEKGFIPEQHSRNRQEKSVFFKNILANHTITTNYTSIRFALFTIRPLVAWFEVTKWPWWIKKGRVAGFHIISSLFNKLKKDVICKPFLKASRGPLDLRPRETLL